MLPDTISYFISKDQFHWIFDKPLTQRMHIRLENLYNKVKTYDYIASLYACVTNKTYFALHQINPETSLSSLSTNDNVDILKIYIPHLDKELYKIILLILWIHSGTMPPVKEVNAIKVATVGLLLAIDQL